LDRKQEGRHLPFELVVERIAEYLEESTRRLASAQYVARLAASAHIEGINLATTTEAIRVK
jgi:peptidyl-prolyl cis-trans isomerase C